LRDAAAAEAGGYVLAVASLLVAVGLVFHPMPAEGFEERPSVLAQTPWWGAIHVAIAAGFVLCALGALLLLVAGAPGSRRWTRALFWGAMAVGMIYFTGVALINGWVMHELAAIGNEAGILYDTMNDLLIGFGWLGNPLFLFGLTGVAIEQLRHRDLTMPRLIAWVGVLAAVLSWGRGIGSATGLYFLEVLIYANVPAFLWLGYYGWCVSALARATNTAHQLQRMGTVPCS
jgi:hypothetical protein